MAKPTQSNREAAASHPHAQLVFSHQTKQAACVRHRHSRIQIENAPLVLRRLRKYDEMRLYLAAIQATDRASWLSCSSNLLLRIAPVDRFPVRLRRVLPLGERGRKIPRDRGSSDICQSPALRPLALDLSAGKRRARSSL